MGGNAFPTPAKRLSTPQLDLLKDHAQATVAPFFTRVEPLRDVRTKADHGDLDLACGWDHHLAWNWKGEDRGVMGSEGGDGLGGKIKSFSEVDARSAQPIDGETKEEKEKREMRIWCFDIAKACQAKEWVRRGSEISLAIPCTVFGDATKEHADDPTAFYQLDLPFVPADSLDFYLLVVSYSTTFLILARALRCLSSSLTLQMTGLIIRHPAYFGIPGIDLRLTSSADELCAYFGLDRAIWEGGFDTEEGVWQWLATVEEGGKLEDAYKRMVGPKAVRQVGHKSKLGALDQFVTFLRGTKYGEGWESMGKKSETAEVTEAERSSTPLPLETPIALPPLSPSTATTISTSPPLTPHSIISNAITEAQLDPEKPVPLDSRARAALERWGKDEAYEVILAERKEVAAVLANNQKRRIESKQKALELQRKKEEEEEMEGKMGGVSLAAAVEAMKV